MSDPAAHRERLKAVLAADPDLDTLVGLARSLKDAGVGQMPLYRLFDAARLEAETADDEARCDLIDEALDAIAGWCEPERRLFATELEL